MSKITLAALTKKHFSNTASKRSPAKSATSNCIYKEDNLFQNKNGLSVAGERIQLLPLPAKTTTHLNTKHGNLGDERAIVLELYKEERESGLSSDGSGGIRWSRSAVKWLKAPAMASYRLPKQVQKENTRMFDEHLEQKKAN